MFGISSRRADQMESASLIVFNGLGLEEGLLHHVSAVADRGVPTLEVAPAVLDAADDDPHFWTDPRQMAAAVPILAAAVVDNVPNVDADVIRRRADRYVAEILELHEASARRLGALPSDRRELVTNHHVFGYFAEAYDLTVVGAIVPSASTLASPSASDLQSLADAIRANAIPAIFVEASHPDRLAAVLADEAGIDIAILELHSESLGEPGSAADTYLRMMRRNVDQIVTGLAGDPP
jgi:zinc/manganese transport system substrate-binding protein